jgi:hypothetical protein
VSINLLEGERRILGDSVFGRLFRSDESVGDRRGNMLLRNEERAIVSGIWGKRIVKGCDESGRSKEVRVASTADRRHLW